jgi:hypothetical protein
LGRTIQIVLVVQVVALAEACREELKLAVERLRPETGDPNLYHAHFQRPCRIVEEGTGGCVTPASQLQNW